MSNDLNMIDLIKRAPNCFVCIYHGSRQYLEQNMLCDKYLYDQSRYRKFTRRYDIQRFQENLNEKILHGNGIYTILVHRAPINSQATILPPRIYSWKYFFKISDKVHKYRSKNMFIFNVETYFPLRQLTTFKIF